MNALAAIHPYNEGDPNGLNEARPRRRSAGTGRDTPHARPCPGSQPSSAWADAWEGYELHLELLGRSRSTVASRKSNALAMARYFTGQGIDPEGVTKLELSRYIVAQAKGRAGAGPQSLFKDLRMFWKWLAEDLEIADPMAKVACPSGKSRPVAVLSWADVEKMLAACAGKTDAETARNVAIIWLFLESGLRRFELAALRLSDVDRKARTVFVRDGKGHKPRTACYGLGTARRYAGTCGTGATRRARCSPHSWAAPSPPRACRSSLSGSARRPG